MSNSGLPEAGDAVLTFPPAILADPDRYAAAADLPNGGAPGTDITTAYRRRDLAVEGFHIAPRRGRTRRPAGDAPSSTPRPPRSSARCSTSGAPAGRTARSGPRSRPACTSTPWPAATRATWRTPASARCSEPAEEGRLGMCGLLNTYPPTP